MALRQLFRGCARTRKGTSGFVALLGKQCVSARSKTQLAIATATAEAEFYSPCSSVSPIKIAVDASAGRAMASRRRLGRAKHIARTELVGPELGAGGQHRFAHEPR